MLKYTHVSKSTIWISQNGLIIKKALKDIITALELDIICYKNNNFVTLQLLMEHNIEASLNDNTKNIVLFLFFFKKLYKSGVLLWALLQYILMAFVSATWINK